VDLDFGLEGYVHQRLSFGRMRDVPASLHIIMRKQTAATAPVEPSPIGKFKLDLAKLHWSGEAYSTVVLQLNADGTATAITTLADNKTQLTYAGIWTNTAKLQWPITVHLEQKAGTPDPASIAGRERSFDLSDDGLRLLDKQSGPNYERIP
jgi:hypothetical protein